jgi:hypothetical protein
MPHNWNPSDYVMVITAASTGLFTGICSIIAAWKATKSDNKSSIVVEKADINGQKLDDIHALTNGNLVSTYIFYLIKMKDDKTFYSYGVELVATDNIFSIKTLTDVIIKALANFTFQMTNESAKEVNLDGGDLGRASEKIHLTK